MRTVPTVVPDLLHYRAPMAHAINHQPRVYLHGAATAVAVAQVFKGEAAPIRRHLHTCMMKNQKDVTTRTDGHRQKQHKSAKQN
jgi:hypothetical protein